ncbi:MAG: ferredoxin reductase family protein [Desulfobulbaceae bacterium]|nr:ferredoxin reductase family protein [Desulfobulbaceae bacterium]
MKTGIFPIILYGLLIVLPLFTAAVVMPSYDKVFTFEAAKALALMIFAILMLQPVLAGRFKWIERPYGLDIMLRFHKYMAMFVTAVIILHPLGISTGYHGTSILYSADVYWPVWFGRSALLVLLLSMLFSLTMVTNRLPFERWRLLHDILNPLLLILIFVHSYFTGIDLQARRMQYLWYVYFAAALGVFCYHRLLRPRLLGRRRYTVTGIVTEAPDVHTVTLVPAPGQKIFPYLPGQFHFLTLHRGPGLPVEEHHFTLSSSPSQKEYLSSTIKTLGDFTATIARTRKGDTATVHGPFGRFSHTLHPDDRDLVFIAGGIGITPLMSMLRFMRDTGDLRPVTLFYANRDESSIVFKKELETIAVSKSANLSLVHILEKPDRDWQGEKGRLNGDMIKKYCGADLQGKTFYVCGPPGLVAAILKILAALDIGQKRIRTEIFSFVN